MVRQPLQGNTVTIGDLVSTLGVSLEALLGALYAEARTDPDVAFMTRLVPGCTAAEVADAEIRIGYALPPLLSPVSSVL
jgi:hypothetical protein